MSETFNEKYQKIYNRLCGKSKEYGCGLDNEQNESLYNEIMIIFNWSIPFPV